MKKKADEKTGGFSRREFIKTSAAVSLAAVAPGVNKAFAAGADKVRVGLIGCGGRGTYDTKNCINSSPNATQRTV